MQQCLCCGPEMSLKDSSKTQTGTCRWVHVVAKRDLAPGDELLLDYGARPLRDFLQGYGFVPEDSPDEVSFPSMPRISGLQYSQPSPGVPHCFEPEMLGRELGLPSLVSKQSLGTDLYEIPSKYEPCNSPDMI